MKGAIKVLLFVFISMSLVGCGEALSGMETIVAPTTYTPTSMFDMPPTPPNPDEIEFYSNQATTAANNAVIAQLTANAVAMQATRYYEQQTAQAQYATSAAISAATGTAVSMQSMMTAQSAAVSSEGTRIASYAQATETSRANIILSTVESAAAAGTAEAIVLAGDTERNISDMHIRQLEQELEQERQANARGNLVVAVMIIVVVLIALLVYSYFQKRLQPQIIQTPQGPPIVLVHTSNGMLPIRHSGLSLPTERLALPSGNVIRERPSVVDVTSFANKNISYVSSELMDKTASWRHFAEWKRTDQIPIGVTLDGPVMIDCFNNPHIMVAGATGTGKTRRMIWQLAVAAARDSYTFAVNERGNDFAPFRNHANIETVRGTHEEIPLITANLLKSAVQESYRRDEILRREEVSMWGLLPKDGRFGPEIVFIIDEFLSIARNRTASSDIMLSMFDSIIFLTSEGRKYGMRFMITATSPGRRALGEDGLTMRDNMSRIALRLKDKAVSHAYLGIDTAATLPDGQFIANVGKQGLVQGVAFNPSEEQVAELVRGGDYTKIERPSWVNISANEPEAVIISNDPLNHPNADDIVRLVKANPAMSKRQIEMEVFGYNGGEAYRVVSQVVGTINKREVVNA